MKGEFSYGRRFVSLAKDVWRLRLKFFSGLKMSLKWVVYIWQYCCWAFLWGLSVTRWLLLWLVLPFRKLGRVIIWLVRRMLNFDIREANRKQHEIARQLDEEWKEGKGRINADELIDKMDTDMLLFSYEIARNEYAREIERRGGLIVDRTAAVMAAAALVLAALCSIVQLGTPSFEPKNQFPWITLIEKPVSVGFWLMVIVGFIELAWGISLCINILIANQIWEPSWETIVSQRGNLQNDLTVQRRWHLRLLLFSTARNQIETQYRLNQNNAAVRHFKMGIWGMSIVLGLRAVPHITQWAHDHFQNNPESGYSSVSPEVKIGPPLRGLQESKLCLANVSGLILDIHSQTKSTLLCRQSDASDWTH